MSTVIPYTPIIIPARGRDPQKIIYSPLLDTFLYFKDKETNFSFRSVVDSGADFCVFPARYGSIIGLDVKGGRPVQTYGVGGEETLYFHRISVGVNIREQLWKISAEVGFSYKMDRKGAGLLGRQGFFDQFTEVAFNQTKKMFRIKE